MKQLVLLTKGNFRLLALILCLAATVPQLHADIVVAGNNTTLFGASWSTQTSASNKMSQYGSTNYYYLAKPNVSLSGTTEYKVVDNGTWYGANGSTSDGNISFSANGTYSIVFIYNTSNHKVKHIGSFQTIVIAGGDTQALGSSWSTNDANNQMTTTDGITYTLSKNVTYSGSASYGFKTVVNGAWYGDAGENNGNNINYTIPEAGEYDVTFTFNAVMGMPSVSVVRANVPTYDYTFYVYLPNGGTPYLYLWNGSNRPNGNWPGGQMTQTERLDDNNDWYKVTVNCEYTTLSAIVDLGNNANQSANITDLAPGTYYITWDGGNKTAADVSNNAPTPPPTPDYYVVGDLALIGHDWAASNDTKMTETSGTYTWSRNDIHLNAGDYNLKVLSSDNTWYGNAQGGNVVVNADANGTYNLAVAFDPTTGIVDATLTKTATDPVYTYDIYVRYAGNEDPGNVYAYVFDSFGNKPLGNWGGTKLTDMDAQTINTYTYYHVTVTSFDPVAKVIFNENQSGSTQTTNLDLQVGDNYFTYNGGSSVVGPTGNPDEEPVITYYVMGDDTSLFPNGWNTGDATAMTDNGDGTYTWTSSEVHLNAGTNYGYKVFGDDNTWHPGGSDNATFNVNRPGAYTVTVTFDGTNVNAVANLVQPDPIYILGDEGLSLTWSYAPTTQMTFDDAEGVFTYTTEVASTTAYHFVFGNGQGNDWDDFNGHYRIGPTGETQEVTINGSYQPTQVANGGSYSFTANPGTVTIYFDVANMQFKVEGNVPTYDYTFYVLPSDANITPYIYLWHGENGEYEPANGWPGSLMTDTETLGDYNTWHKYTLASSTDVLNAIVNLDHDGQTGDIMNLAPDTYYIKWNTTTNEYEITTEAPTPPVIYIEGSTGLGLTWSPVPTQLMTADPQTGIYSYSYEVTEAGTYNFVFANGQGNDAEDWDNFNTNFRIGPTAGTQAIDLDGQWHQTQMAGGDFGSYRIAVEPGMVTIYYNPTDMTFMVEGNAEHFTYTFYVLPDNPAVTPYLYLWGINDIHYTSAYPGDALTETVVLDDGNTWYKKTVSITTDFINALVSAGGNNADDTKTKDITYIDPGTYYIYWTTDRNTAADILYDENNQPIYRYNHYEMYIDAPGHPGEDLYMHGDYTYGGDHYNYSPSNAAKMKYDANTGTYYLNNVTLNNNTTFCFSNLLSDDWNNQDRHRYGNGAAEGYTENPDGTNYLEVNDTRINRNLPLDMWSDINGEYRMFTSGIFNVLVNPEQHWVKLIKTDHMMLTPMNIYLEQTSNVKIDNVQEPGTTYTAQMFDNGYWPLSAYNAADLGETWDPNGDNHYGVKYIGDTITVDGKKWWHWEVTASICEFFFTRTNTDRQPAQSDVIRRKSGVQWITWDEVDGTTTMTDHTREYFEAAANALPSNVVVIEGHYYVYFINTVGWQNVYCYAWDNNVDEQGQPDNFYADGYSRVMSQWPGKPCERIGIDPVTGYEVWRYDFGTIAGTDAPNGGIIFNDGNNDQGSQVKEQTGDFDYINGGVYDYLGLFDGAYTLNNLIRTAAMDVRYTVSNALVGVYYDKDAETIIHYTDINGELATDTIVGALYAKDMNLYGEKSYKPDASYSDYVYDICYANHVPGGSQVMQKKTTYDQSNWIKLVISPNYDGGSALPVAENKRPNLEEFESRIIPAGTLELFMTDTINPTGHIVNITKGDPMAYEPNVYVPYSFNDSYVFTYTHQDWPHEEYEGVYLTRPVVTWNTTPDGTVTGGTVVNKPDESRLYKMFYVAPKPQEVAYVTWIVYDNDNLNGEYPGYYPDRYTPYTPVASFLPEDPGRFYAPANWNRSIPISSSVYDEVQYLDYDEWENYYHQKISDVSNGYMQLGGVKVNWSLFDEEKVGMPWWQIFQPGQAYKLKAIVRYAHDNKGNMCYEPSNGYIDWDNHNNDAPGSSLNAPRRENGANGQGGYANMYFTSEYDMTDSKFILFPIEASPDPAHGSSMGNVTTVKEVAVNRTVTGVRYYNLMGVSSDKPFDGINIVVTTYSDGSRTSKKVLR